MVEQLYRIKKGLFLKTNQNWGAVGKVENLDEYSKSKDKKFVKGIAVAKRLFDKGLCNRIKYMFIYVNKNEGAD